MKTAQMSKDEYEARFDSTVYAAGADELKKIAEKTGVSEEELNKENEGKIMLRPVIQADFISGTYEMIDVFIKAVEKEYMKNSVIIHGVFDEFQDACK